RLGVMRDTDDGFVIAEEDLQLRGAGELLGTRQSGMPEFRFADLVKHQHLAQIARDDIKLLLHNDPELQSPRGQALRTLLYLFEYDVHPRYLRAGQPSSRAGEARSGISSPHKKGSPCRCGIPGQARHGNSPYNPPTTASTARAA